MSERSSSSRRTPRLHCIVRLSRVSSSLPAAARCMDTNRASPFSTARWRSRPPPGAAVYSQLATYLLAEDDGRHRRLAAAADAYSSAVRLTPKDAQLHLSLGLQQHKRGLWDEAVSAYERAISLEPINGEAYALLGSLRLHRMQRLKRTEQALLAAVTARQRLERRRITDESYGAGIATATEAEARATRQEFGQVLQLQGKLDDAKRFAAEQDASRAEAASAAWALQNELTLPMYVWRHRSNFSAVVDGGGSNGTKVHGGFLKGCGGVSSSSGPAAGRLRWRLHHEASDGRIVARVQAGNRLAAPTVCTIVFCLRCRHGGARDRGGLTAALCRSMGCELGGSKPLLISATKGLGRSYNRQGR